MTSVFRTVAIADVIDVLSAANGPVLARERVESALAALSLPPFGRLPNEDAVRLLEHLQAGGGALGVVCAQTVRRLATTGRLRGTSGAGFAAVNTDPPASGVRTVTRRELVVLLSASAREEDAETAVTRAAERVGFGPSGTEREALAVLEVVAGEEGNVATAAVFAKARFHLR
jgi:hypothetical protein